MSLGNKITSLDSPVLVCGPTSKNGITGLSLAFDLLIDALRKSNIRFFVVDSSSRKMKKEAGSFGFGRAFESLLVIAKIGVCLPKTQIFYCTMATSTMGFFREWASVKLARFFGNKVILHLHGGGFGVFFHNSRPFLRRMITRHINRVDTVIVLGQRLMSQFLNAGFPESLLRVVPNGLPVGLSSDNLSTKTINGESKINLLFLSNLMASKGVFEVINAVKILNEKSPGRFHLWLCGDFVLTHLDRSQPIQSRRELELYLESRDLTDCISYMGVVDGEKKEHLLREAHVFVLPTYYEWEGQPISIIEAQAFGTPAVVTEHRGIPEQVIAGVTGEFVPAKNPPAVADAVERIVNDPVVYRSMSLAARENFESHFTKETHQEKLLSVLFEGKSLV